MHSPISVRAATIRAAFVALLVSSSLCLGALLPPEHVHEADADHPASLVHRHFEAHRDEGVRFDHDDGRIVWLNEIALARPVFHFIPAVETPHALVATRQPSTRWISRRAARFVLPHGPPHPTYGLRAPPLFV
jgi:hypothetical protein